VLLFDGKDYMVLYDNGCRGKYHAQQEVAWMILSPELVEQVHVRSGVQGSSALG
jgi:hypothetical protein